MIFTIENIEKRFALTFISKKLHGIQLTWLSTPACPRPIK
jgi:hypothetical protein